MLPLPPQQADIELPATEIESSVQHMKRASLVLRRLVNTTERFINGGPPSWQSIAGAEHVRAEARALWHKAVVWQVAVSVLLAPSPRTRAGECRDLDGGAGCP